MASGLAPSLPFLVIARMVQGIGAALVTPTSLALIREEYDDAGERARALGYWALGGSIAAAAGPIVGGALVQANWRLIFFINVPVGLLALIVLARVADSPRQIAHFDWLGQVTAVLGLAALTYGCIEGGAIGFSAARVVAAFVLSVAALAVFLLDQTRSRHPMVPLALFRARPVAITLSVAFVTMAGFYGTVFLQSLYLQQGRGYSAFVTGLLFLPMTALVAVTSLLVARVVKRFGHVIPIAGGQLGMMAGLVGLALLPAEAPVLAIAGLMILVGVGGAFTVPAIASLIFDNLPANLAGTGSGVLNTFRQMGGSLGVAVFGAIVNASAAFLAGLRVSYIATAVLLGATGAATLTLRRQSRPASTRTKRRHEPSTERT